MSQERRNRRMHRIEFSNWWSNNNERNKLSDIWVTTEVFVQVVAHCRIKRVWITLACIERFELNHNIFELSWDKHYLIPSSVTHIVGSRAASASLHTTPSWVLQLIHWSKVPRGTLNTWLYRRRYLCFLLRNVYKISFYCLIFLQM